ncbi:MAG: hypothetical protein ACOYXS_01125 [Chloroflexota bacterium]
MARRDASKQRHELGIPFVGLLHASFVLEAPWSRLAFELGLSLPVLILRSDRLRGWWLELIGRAENVGRR